MKLKKILKECDKLKLCGEMLGIMGIAAGGYIAFWYLCNLIF